MTTLRENSAAVVHLDAITSDDDGSVYAFRGEFHIVVSSRQHYSDRIFFFL